MTLEEKAHTFNEWLRKRTRGVPPKYTDETLVRHAQTLLNCSVWTESPEELVAALRKLWVTKGSMTRRKNTLKKRKALAEAQEQDRQMSLFPKT